MYYKNKKDFIFKEFCGGVVMKDWIITENDKLKAKELAKQSGIPPFLAMLLSSRGIDTVEKTGVFLSDDAELSDPMLIKDMDIACERIRKAVVSYEKICVYGGLRL